MSRTQQVIDTVKKRPRHVVAAVLFALALPLVASYYPSKDAKQLSAGGTVENNGNVEKTSESAETIEGNKFDLQTGKYRGMVAGIWHNEYYGHRYMTIESDGTATMDIYPNTFGQMMVGSKYVHMDITWDYAEGFINFENISGTPQKSFDFINKQWGAKSRRKLTDMTEETLVLFDESDGKDYVWKRVESIPQKEM